MLPIELCFLNGRWTEELDPHPLAHIIRNAVNCNFREVLTDNLCKALFIPADSISKPLEAFINCDALQELDVDHRELLRLTVGITCLHAFIQINWTGPALDISPLEVLSSGSLPNEDAARLLNSQAISELAYSGEPAYHLAQHAAFLRLSQILLAPQYGSCVSATWWRFRVERVHQQMLDEAVVVPSEVTASLRALKDTLAQSPVLSGSVILEEGLLQHQYKHDKHAAELFVAAARATSMEYELTGALGKRTKFQAEDLSQLVLLAESHLPADADSKDSSEQNKNGTADGAASTLIPETLALNDDTLLEKTQFTSSNPSASSTSRLAHIDPSSQPSLHPIDQCILLAMCLNVRNTSPAHGLTNEQMAPYVTRVIEHPRNWTVHTMALLLRARLEAHRTRTAERAVLQLQALVDQMPTADSTTAERLKYFHQTPLPSKWELERELAMRFLSLGVVKSALEIFERLEMWEEVVKCWQSMERRDKGVAIVRDLLEGKIEEADTVLAHRKEATSEKRRHALGEAREAKLWCLLGDLEPDNAVEHYQHAWEISKGGSGRAMRALGGYYFTRADYKQAITMLRKAVAINPLQAQTWFILGCACIREEDWEGGREAFMRCVALDDEDGESWNNLASMYLHLGEEGKKVEADEDETNPDVDGEDANSASRAIPFSNKMLAYRALKQGLRFSYDNWRMWANYMVVAMDVGELAEATRALGRVVEERATKDGAECVDVDVLDRLVNAVTRAPSDPIEAAESTEGTPVFNPNEGHGLLRRINDLFERVLLPQVSSPRIFRAYARLLMWQDKWGDALKAHLDGYRAGVAGTMEKGETDVSKFREAVREVQETVDVLSNFGPRVEGSRWKMQACSIVRTFMGRTRDFEDEDEWETLRELQEELKKDD